MCNAAGHTERVCTLVEDNHVIAVGAGIGSPPTTALMVGAFPAGGPNVINEEPGVGWAYGQVTWGWDDLDMAYGSLIGHVCAYCCDMKLG